jgi:hypothetical protein
MAILRFFKFEARQTIIVSSRLPHPTQQVQILKKWAKLILLSAAGCHTRLDRQHCLLRTYHRIFLRLEKPSEDINRHLFLMNKKGLNLLPTV